MFTRVHVPKRNFTHTWGQKQYFGGTVPEKHSGGTGLVTLFWGTILVWEVHFSLEGIQAVIWGGHGPKMSPVGLGLYLIRIIS